MINVNTLTLISVLWEKKLFCDLLRHAVFVKLITSY